MSEPFRLIEVPDFSKFPKCSWCNDPITDDYLYKIGDDIYCEQCMRDHYRHPVEEYMDD